MPKRAKKEPLPPPSAVDLNPEITKRIQALSNKYKSERDFMRQRSYSKAAAALAEFGWVITLDNYKRTAELKGVGKGTVNRLEEYLNTGDIAEVAAFLDDPVEKAATELGKVHGVGAKKAGELAAAGVRGIADLKSRPDTVAGLSDAQRTGLQWVREMQSPKTREAVQAVGKALQEAVAAANPGFTLSLAGEFRRGEGQSAGGVLPVLVTYAGHEMEDPGTVLKVLKRKPEANKGPALLAELHGILSASGVIVADLDGGAVTRTFLALTPEQAAVYDTPAPVGAPVAPEVEEVEEDVVVVQAPAPAPVAVAAAGLVIPDLDDAEEAVASANTAVKGVYAKAGGLAGARAATVATVGGRKRRADGPAVEMLDPSAAPPAQDESVLAPVEGTCPITVQLNMVPANFAVAARFSLTGPRDYITNVTAAARKQGLRLTKYALRRITAVELSDGSTRTIAPGASAVVAPKDGKVKKEVLGPVMPLADEQALYTALGGRYTPPDLRTPTGTLVLEGGAAE